jgi:hypothetical protein
VKPRVSPPPAAPKTAATTAGKAREGAAKAEPQAAAKAKAKEAAEAKGQAAAKAAALGKARQRARARVETAKRKRDARTSVKRAKGPSSAVSSPPRLFEPEPEPAVAVPVVPARGGDTRALLTSPLVGVVLIVAAALALISMLLATLPLGALERLLAAEAHYRSEQAVNFVDGHRLDLAVAGVATLLVAAVVALPTITG